MREAMELLLRPLLGLRKRSAKVLWTPLLLAACAVLMAWDAQPTLAGRFESAGVALADLYPRREAGQTYQGFVKALKACRVAGLGLEAHVAAYLRRRVREVAQGEGGKGGKGKGGKGKGGHWLRHGWCAFAADGSKFDVPRTRKNEEAFESAGRKKSGPQMYLTSLWHMGTGLPWAWVSGGAKSSERHHLRQMLPLLPPGEPGEPGEPGAGEGEEGRGVLLVADAGFVGYDLLTEVLASGRHLLIRVGANVRLLSRLGFAVEERGDTVYLWPDGQQAKCRSRRRPQDRPPLVLRLIRLPLDQGAKQAGAKQVCLLTDVTDRSALSEEAAGALYRMRWGVELFYRAMKQKLGRRKMLSAAPAQAGPELHWSVIGLLALGLLAVRRVIEAGNDPLGWSAALALKAVRRALRRPHYRPATPLAQQLGNAVKDGYQRKGSKKARDWPHKKKDKPPGEPKLREATDAEVALAKEIREKKAAA
jgi:hypothetical protein